MYFLQIAFKAYDVFYRSWKGLDELAASLGLYWNANWKTKYIIKSEIDLWPRNLWNLSNSKDIFVNYVA